MRGLVGAGLVALVACGGRSEIGGTGGVIGAVAAGSGGDDGSEDAGDGSGDDSSIDFAVCPDAPPAPGSACDSPGQGCRYPDSTTKACVACNASRIWVSAPGQCP